MNRQKYVMDESIDSELEQFYQSLNETEEKYNKQSSVKMNAHG